MNNNSISKHCFTSIQLWGISQYKHQKEGDGEGHVRWSVPRQSLISPCLARVVVSLQMASPVRRTPPAACFPCSPALCCPPVPKSIPLPHSFLLFMVTSLDCLMGCYKMLLLPESINYYLMNLHTICSYRNYNKYRGNIYQNI